MVKIFVYYTLVCNICWWLCSTLSAEVTEKDFINLQFNLAGVISGELGGGVFYRPSSTKVGFYTEYANLFPHSGHIIGIGIPFFQEVPRETRFYLFPKGTFYYLPVIRGVGYWVSRGKKLDWLYSFGALFTAGYMWFYDNGFSSDVGAGIRYLNFPKEISNATSAQSQFDLVYRFGVGLAF